ncbi:ABC transporter permease [Spiroplasma sp. BIUS-1]|uniref:ABC transporter permease n=1 Tax=Spiroplasma sp. BIUS-1 TaxID=216964 RepID=UPI001397AC59|nr:ABC transporter permease [Spiroplasma sp. BIUS-1]QHX36612.1 hypothetical protein SBIUS_v1c03590 [Spiroplasma sp. BIUS-1]
MNNQNSLKENQNEKSNGIHVFKRKKAKSRVLDYEKVGWNNFFILLKINLRSIFKSIPILVSGVLFVISNLLITLSMHFIKSDNGQLNYSVFSILLSAQYIIGVTLFSIFITIICIFLMKMHKNSGIQNIELRAGVSPTISFILRVVVIVFTITFVSTINYVLNILVSLGINFGDENGLKILTTSFAFWYLYGLLFASIAILAVQVVSLLGSTMLLVFVGLLFAVAPALTNLSRSTSAMKRIIAQKDIMYKMYPNLVAGQEFYNILSSENIDTKLSNLTNDQNFFSQINKNIGELFLGGTDKVISFEDFSSDNISSFVYDANTLLQFLVQTGNYNVQMTTKFENKNDKMNDYLLTNTALYNLIDDMRIRLDNSNFVDNQENEFLITDNNPNKIVYTDIDPAINVLKKSYGSSNTSMNAFLDLISYQKKQLEMYDLVSKTSEKVKYESEPQYYNSGGYVIPKYKYDQNSIYMDLKQEHKLSSSMQMISYMTMQLYKDLYMAGNNVDRNFDIDSFLKTNTSNYYLDSTNKKYNLLNMLNILNHPVLIYLNGQTSPMTWNYLFKEVSLINKYSLVDFKVNINYSAWSHMYIDSSENPNLNKPNKTSNDAILFASRNEGRENHVIVKNNILVSGIVIWYLFISSGLITFSYFEYIKRARY